MMQPGNLSNIFSKEALNDLLPPQLSDDFFEALYGDAAEGAYDIRLAFSDHNPAQHTLTFELRLHQRPGKCLACNLTYGLPQVFARHPLIDVEGMVRKIDGLLGEEMKCTGWELGHTQTPADDLHTIPLTIWLA